MQYANLPYWNSSNETFLIRLCTAMVSKGNACSLIITYLIEVEQLLRWTGHELETGLKITQTQLPAQFPKEDERRWVGGWSREGRGSSQGRGRVCIE